MALLLRLIFVTVEQTWPIDSPCFDSFLLRALAFVLRLQPLVYERSAGERDLFAHPLTRGDWQKAGKHNEQICSRNRSHTRGIVGCLPAYGGRGKACPVSRRARAHSSKKKKTPTYSYVDKKSGVVELKTVQLSQPSPAANCCMLQLLYFSVTNELSAFLSL